MAQLIRCLTSVGLALVLVGGMSVGDRVIGGAAIAQNVAAAAQEPAKPAPPKPGTHRVEKGPFRIDVTLSGVFEAKQMTEVALRPEAWAELVIVDAVPQGTRVQKGDRLVTLDTRRIDEVIRDLENGRSLADLAIRQAQEDLRITELLLPQDLSAAEQANQNAEQDLRRFLEIDRPLSLKSAEFSLRSATDYFEYQQEELKQLEKMYNKDDLTEETEEIILRRQRDAVEQAKFTVERAKIGHDQTLRVDVPRREKSFEEAARRQAVAADRARTLLPMGLGKKRLDLEKMAYDRERAADRLEKLEKDRAAMTVLAPAGGIVYYGRSISGSWATAPAVAAKMLRGGALMPHEVFITIVEPRPMFVHAAASEGQLQHLRAGLEGRALPTAFPGISVQARVESVSATPMAGGSFDVKITAELGEAAAALMPGMTASVRLAAYSNPEAITVPASAVFSDAEDETKTHVFVMKEGKSEKRPVRVGKRADQKAEIVQGLGEGDEILLEDPTKKPGGATTPGGGA